MAAALLGSGGKQSLRHLCCSGACTAGALAAHGVHCSHAASLLLHLPTETPRLLERTESDAACICSL